MNQNKLTTGERRELRFRQFRNKIIRKELPIGVKPEQITMKLVRNEIDPEISIKFQLWNKFIRT